MDKNLIQIADKEALRAFVLSTLNEVLKEMGVGKVEAKYGVIPDPNNPNDELEGLSKEEKIAKFLKGVYLKDNGILEKFGTKALSGDVDTAGGYLVPDEFRAEVIRIAEVFGVSRRICRVIPLKRDTLKIPTLTGSVTVYWVGQKAQIPASDPTFGQKTLTAQKAAGITSLANELLEDADVDIVALLTELFGEAIGVAEDEQFLAGTGSPITGVLGDTGTNVVTMATGKTSFSDVTYDDLVDVIDATPSSVLESGRCRWVFHRNILNVLRKLKDSNGNPIFNQGVAGGAPATILGYPYSLSDKMPGLASSAADTKFIAFGDFGRYIIGDRKQIAIKIAQEATVGTDNLFEQDMSAIRVLERVGGVLGAPTAISVLKTAAA